MAKEDAMTGGVLNDATTTSNSSSNKNINNSNSNNTNDANAGGRGGKGLVPFENLKLTHEQVDVRPTKNIKMKQHLCVKHALPKTRLTNAILYENVSQGRHLEMKLAGQSVHLLLRVVGLKLLLF